MELASARQAACTHLEAIDGDASGAGGLLAQGVQEDGGLEKFR